MNRMCQLMMYVLIALTLSGCGGKWLLFYDAKIPGSVVEVDTGKAIEGAVVVGLWAYTDLFGGGHGGFANIEVMESNMDGSFKIPAWIWLNPLKILYFVEDSDPLIVIYKPGYKIHTYRKNWITGIDNPINMTDEEKAKVLIEHGITPARLIKLSSDKQKIENISELSRITLLSNWPIVSFSKSVLNKAIIEEINTLNIQSNVKEKMLNHYK